MKFKSRNKNKIKVAILTLFLGSVTMVSVSFAVASFSYKETANVNEVLTMKLENYFGADTLKKFKPEGAAGENYSSSYHGNGTKSYPYIISTYQHLLNLQILNSLGFFNSNDYFVLYNDIDCKDSSGNYYAPMLPIGTRNTPFYSTFDGCCYKINNLKVAGVGSDSGLFGYVGTSGVIKNFMLVDAEVIVDNSYYNSDDTLYPLYYGPQSIYYTQADLMAKKFTVSELSNTDYFMYAGDTSIRFQINGEDNPSKLNLNSGVYDWGIRINGDMFSNKKNDDSFDVTNHMVTIKSTCKDGYYTIDLVANYKLTNYVEGDSIASYSKTGRYCFERFRVYIQNGKFVTLPDFSYGGPKVKQLLYGKNTRYRYNSYYGSDNYKVRLAVNYVGLVCGWLDGTASGIGVYYKVSDLSDSEKPKMIRINDGIKSRSYNLFIGRIKDVDDASLTNDVDPETYYSNRRMYDAVDFSAGIDPGTSINSVTYKNNVNDYFETYDLDDKYYIHNPDAASPFDEQKYKYYSPEADLATTNTYFKQKRLYSGTFKDQYTKLDDLDIYTPGTSNEDYRFLGGNSYYHQSAYENAYYPSLRSNGTGIYSMMDDSSKNSLSIYDNFFDIVDDNGVRYNDAQLLTTNNATFHSRFDNEPYLYALVNNINFDSFNDTNSFYSMVFGDSNYNPKLAMKKGLPPAILSNNYYVGKPLIPGEMMIKIGGPNDFLGKSIKEHFGDGFPDFFVDIDIEYLYLSSYNKATDTTTKDQYIEKGPQFMVYTTFEKNGHGNAYENETKDQKNPQFGADLVTSSNFNSSQKYKNFLPPWTQKGYWSGRGVQTIQKPGSDQETGFYYGVGDPMGSYEDAVNRPFVAKTVTPGYSNFQSFDNIGTSFASRVFSGVTSGLGYVEDDGGSITMADENYFSEKMGVPVSSLTNNYGAQRYYAFDPENDLTYYDERTIEPPVTRPYYRTKHKKIRLRMTPSHLTRISASENITSSELVKFYADADRDPTILIPINGANSNDSRFYIKGVKATVSLDSENPSYNKNAVTSVDTPENWTSTHEVDTAWTTCERILSHNYVGYSNYINFTNTDGWTTSLVNLADGNFTNSIYMDPSFVGMTIKIETIMGMGTMYRCDYYSRNSFSFVGEDFIKLYPYCLHPVDMEYKVYQYVGNLVHWTGPI